MRKSKFQFNSILLRGDHFGRFKVAYILVDRLVKLDSDSHRCDEIIGQVFHIIMIKELNLPKRQLGWWTGFQEEDWQRNEEEHEEPFLQQAYRDAREEGFRHGRRRSLLYTGEGTGQYQNVLVYHLKVSRVS